MRLSKWHKLNQMEGGFWLPSTTKAKNMAEYYTQIKANPHFPLRSVSPLLKFAHQRQKAYFLKDCMRIGDITYSVGFDPFLMELTIKWVEEGHRNEQKILVLQEPSNIRSLSGAFVYYFLCPRTGVKCRTLYKMMGGGFYSRKALPRAYYPLQIDSKKWRYINYPPEESAPYRRNGKAYYRGKLTPYGKKLQRWEKAKDRQDEAFANGILQMLH